MFKQLLLCYVCSHYALRTSHSGTNQRTGNTEHTRFQCSTIRFEQQQQSVIRTNQELRPKDLLYFIQNTIPKRNILGRVYDHEVEEGVFLSLFDHDLAESVILDCPIAEN